MVNYDFRANANYIYSELTRIEKNIKEGLENYEDLKSQINTLAMHVNQYRKHIKMLPGGSFVGETITDEKGKTFSANVQDFQAELAELNEMLEKNRKPVNPTPSPDSKPKPQTTLDDEIKDFKTKVGKMEDDIRAILTKLTYEDQYKDTIEMVKQLDAEFQEIRNLAEDLKKDIMEFKDKNLGNPKLEVNQVNEIIKTLRAQLRKIKTTQRDQYNAKVNYANRKIDKLKEELKNRANDPLIDEDTRNVIQNLSYLELSSGTFKNEGNIGYLDKIRYNELLEKMNLINKLEEKLGKEPEKIDLESDMLAIEDKLNEIRGKIAPEMTLNDINALWADDFSTANALIWLFKKGFGDNKDKIAPEVYDAYDKRLIAAENEKDRLREEIGKIKVSGKENNVYLGFQRELDMLNGQVTDFGLRIGKESIVDTDLPRQKDDLDKLEQSLNEIGDRIDEAFHNGLLDDNQIKNLSETYNEIKQKIEENRKKLNDPENIKNIDEVFDFFNGQIDGLEAEIKELGSRVDKLPDHVKDKKVRKDIDAVIARLENEIKDIRESLEKYKDKNPDKYEEYSNRLKEQEEKLDKISKNYRSKCPLRVRFVKTAKDLYKKHKKVILIAAGLAAVALLAQPIIIPAIMHGNLMLMETFPAARGMLFGINNILSKVIGAKTIAGELVLSSGAIINPTVAASSFLRGLAFSGIGTAALITPVVIAIKELYNKMNKVNLKEKLSNGTSKVKGTVSRAKDRVKSAVSHRKNNSAYEKLYEEFKNYGGTLEEFAKDYDLDEKHIIILREIDKQHKMNETETEENTQHKGGGRKQW